MGVVVTADSDDTTHSVELFCEPGILTRWVLDTTTFTRTESTVGETRTRCFPRTLLEVEKVIADCIDQHGASVARVVHTFGGRDIHLRNGSRIEYRWEPVTRDLRCLDCGISTEAINEYYALCEEVWEQANPDGDGHLCIGCVEQRLGRILTPSDFTDAPINTRAKPRSARLADRLGARYQ